MPIPRAPSGTAEFQSTLPRRERRQQYYCKQAGKGISIHAPAKGATFRLPSAVPRVADFNPRSREGSDTQCCRTPCRLSYFNPRSREGSDHGDVLVLRCSSISIHAPAKGATANPRPPSVPVRYFNPRSREGSDLSGSMLFAIGTLFQSTLPRRERLYRLRVGQRSENFNPRSREGSDAQCCQHSGNKR